MIASEVSIYNLALNAIGSRDNIASPSENSREAEVCHLWYSPVRDQILTAAPWPEATKFDYPALASQQDGTAWALGKPRPDYTYSYTLPADCLRPQYLTTFDRFIVAGRKLHANMESALLAYTFRQEQVSEWSSELQMAVVYGLASHICMPLTGKTTRVKLMLDQANNIILAARLTAANTPSDDFESLPDWIAGRGYSGASQAATKFIYPYNALLTVSNV